MSKNPANLLNLLTLAQAIEAKAKPATVAARTEACERCGKRVPVGSLFHDDETEQAICGSCPRAPLALTLRAQDAAKAPAPMALPERAWIDESETLKRQLADAIAGREAFKAEAHRNADARDAARRELSEMTEARRICVDRIATLTRELAEARADRQAEDRTAERVQVRTDADGWHFLAPQGEGTADRIKAIGGRWVFHKRTDRARFHAAGYWLVPHSPEAADLLISLRFADKRIDVRSL